MKAYFLQSTETEMKLELRDAPKPEPKPGQMLVRVRAASLNRGELIVGHGLTQAGAAKRAGVDGDGSFYRTGDALPGAWPAARA